MVRDYRFILLTFVVGMIVGLFLLMIKIEKANWLIGGFTGLLFVIWIIALFGYMEKEV